LRALRSKAEASDIDNKYLTDSIASISTKSVSKRASVRNRIKRHIRAAFLIVAPFITWLAAVVVQPSAVQEECDYQQFLQELKQLLAEAEVLNGIREEIYYEGGPHIDLI